MFNDSDVQRILEQAMSTTADFAEVFQEVTESKAVGLLNGKVIRASTGFDSGTGIRLLAGTNSVYVYSSDNDIEVLLKLVKEAAAAIKGSDKGKIEAARSMGSGVIDIIFRVYIHEAVPELIRVTTITAISLIGLTTMAGAVGAGGIGSFAINYGQGQHHQDIVNVCVIVLLIVVTLIQALGALLAKKTTNRALFLKTHKKH